MTDEKVKKVVKKAVVKKAAKKAVVKKAAVKKIVLPPVNEDLIAQIENTEQELIVVPPPPVIEVAPEPPAKRDYTEAKKKYKILDPDKLDIKQRLPEVLALCGAVPAADPLQGVFASIDRAARDAEEGAANCKLAADVYKQLLATKARLPKFTKWVTSLYHNDQAVNKVIAQAGKDAGKWDMLVSADEVDILRAADTKHYWSCLGVGDGYEDVLRTCVEKCDGIWVAYIDSPVDGKMLWRSWQHLIEVDGKLAVGVMRAYGNGGDLTALAKYYKEQGYDTYFLTNDMYNDYYDCPVLAEAKIKVKPGPGLFTEYIHWDLYTWQAHLYGQKIKVD